MKIQIFKHTWTVVSCHHQTLSKLPTTSNVYMIFVKPFKKKRRKIVYIGVTKNLKSRFKGHEILRLLKRNEYMFEIQLFFNSFGCHGTNKSKERGLIHKHTPVFNGNCKQRIRYTTTDFWNELNINFVKMPKGKILKTH